MAGGAQLNIKLQPYRNTTSVQSLFCDNFLAKRGANYCKFNRVTSAYL